MRVGDVVGAGRVEVQLGHHAPHRLAQERRHLHGGVAAADGVVGRTAEIGGEQRLGVVRAHPRVRGDAGQVEHRRAEAGILEVDQPQLPAVVDEVRGQEVMVAEDDRHGRLRPLHLGRQLQEPVKARGHAALALGQCARVVADHVEDPEEVGRAADVTRHLVVEPANHRRDAVEVGAYVIRATGAALDEARDHDARPGMHHLGGEAGGVGGAGDRQLALAADVVEGEVAAEAHDVAARVVLDRKALVREAARQRLPARAAPPERQRLDPFARVHRAVPARRSRRRVRARRFSRHRARVSVNVLVSSVESIGIAAC